MKLLNKMIVLATNAHAGQFDKGGKPYILHPLKVMELTGSTDEEVLCIAVGHDLLEDTKVTIFHLRAIGMTDRIIEGIVALTKMSGESYEEYKQGVLENADARIVKKADLRHNSDITRLKGVTEKDIARVGRYMKFYDEIEKTTS